MWAFFKSRPNSKKGLMGMDELKDIILLLAGAIVVIMLIGYFSETAAEEASATACHDSLVYTSALMKQIPAGEKVKRWPSACRTSKKTIDDTEQTKAMGKVLKLMGDCWYTMGKGEIKPFDTDWIETSNKCFICYTVSFPNLQGTITASDIIAQMAKTPAPDGKMYSEYMQAGAIEQLLSEPITNSKVYAILYSNKEAVVGSGRDQAVTIWELNKASDKCDIRSGES